MFTKSGIIAKQSIVSRTQRGLQNILLRAFADEGGTEGAEGAEPNNTINFETLIANARKEEKDKLYPRIKKLEEENKALIQNHNDTLMKLASTQQELESLRANNGESDTVKDLKAQLETARGEIETLKASTPNEEDIRAKVEAEYEVKFYRQTKLSEGSDKILSVFADEVKGATKEEIDASFDKAVEKTVQTKKQLGLLDDNGNPTDDKKKKNNPQKKDDKGNNVENPTTPPIVNPSEEEDEGFDVDYVRNLDPRSAEYAEFRKKMGLK